MKRRSVRALTDFVDIYEEHVWSVYGFFAYRGAVAEDAEDLTQLTFEKALAAWERFDAERASEITWLLAIARNVYADHRRREGGKRAEREGVAAVWGARTHEPGPDEGAQALSPVLAGAMARLRRRERVAIALRFGADLRGPEIAEVMEITLANAQQILSRAMRKLRRELEGSAEGTGAGDAEGADGEQ